MLAVPMWGPETREDLSITDPAERRRLYGQADHVRMYGHDRVFESRLEAAGFDVFVSQMIDEMDPALRRRYRVTKNEPVHCCTYGQPKPPARRRCAATRPPATGRRRCPGSPRRRTNLHRWAMP